MLPDELGNPQAQPPPNSSTEKDGTDKENLGPAVNSSENTGIPPLKPSATASGNGERPTAQQNPEKPDKPPNVGINGPSPTDSGVPARLTGPNSLFGVAKNLARILHTRITALAKHEHSTEGWIFQSSRLSADGVTGELRHSAKPKGLWVRFRENIKDLGPALSGLAAAVIAFLVFWYGKEINERQANTQARQASAQTAQAETARNDLQLKILSEFSKSLAELSSSDKTARTLAAIRIAQYKSEALPSIKPALGVAEEDVRTGAITVVMQLFDSEAVKREELLKSLRDYFHTRNAHLRIGILECFVELHRRLSSDEAAEITSLLANELNPLTAVSRPEEEEVLREAAVFLGLWPSRESVNLLLGIAKNRTCLPARIQAVDNLPKVAKSFDPEFRKTIVDELKALKVDAPPTLKRQIVLAIEDIKSMGTQ